MEHRSRSIRRRGVVGLVLGGLVAASALVSGTAASAAPTKSTLRIGVPVALSGVAAGSWKYSKPAAIAWGKWVNANGGINGHPVKMYVVDTGPDAVKALASIRQLVEKDDVLAIVGAADTNETAWHRYVQRKKVPVVGGGVGNTSNYQNSYIFPVGHSVPVYMQTIPVLAKMVGAKKIGQAVCGELAACLAADSLVRPAAAKVGVKYGGTFAISQTQPSYTAECLAIKDREMDYVQLQVSAGAANRFAADCEKQGVRPTFGVAPGAFNEALQTFDASAIMAISSGFPWWSQKPPVRNFRAVMKKYAPGESYKSMASTATWQALELFRKAMADASDKPTRQEVVQAMYKLKGETAGGLIPNKLTFVPGKPSREWRCYFVSKVSHGVFTSVGRDLTPSCTP